VNDGTLIGPTLAVGSYTIDSSSCSGLSLSSTNYTLSYAGATNGFGVFPAPVTASVSGSQTYGSSSPSFSYVDSPPSGVSVSGTLSCKTVNGGTLIAPTLAVGTYTIDGSSCSGLSLSSTNYTLSYAGATSGFVVLSAPIAVTVSGSQTYGSSSPSFSYVDSPPSGVSVSGTLSCKTVNDGTLIGPTLAVGSYTIDSSSCSGLSLSSTNYTLSYAGATSGFVVSVPQPVALNDSYSTPINTTLTVSAAKGILANDSLNAGKISSHSQPGHGTLTLNPDGSFIYVPNHAFWGTDTFTYTLTNTAGSSTATVAIQVGPAISDVAVTLSAPSSAKTGTSFSYTLTVKNNGPNTASSVMIDFSVPSGATPVSDTGNPSSMLHGTLLIWSVPTLTSSSSVTYSVTVKVTKTSGTLVSQASALPQGSADQNLSNNFASATTTVTK
jgi:uncharacterized repeat protein (TIGR01451 family)